MDERKQQPREATAAGKFRGDWVLTQRQAEYLAAEAGLEPELLVGKRARDLESLVGHLVNPISLLFERVCGRVIKHGPGGVIQGVPNATVHV